MQSPVKAYLWAIAATVIVAGVLFGLAAAIFQAGRVHERGDWQKKEAAAARKFAQELQAEVKRGETAVASVNSSLLALTTRYSTLEGAYRELSDRVPLVLPVPAAARRADRRTADPSHAGPGPQAAAAPHDEGQLADGGRHRLSLGAVWMWNSSLTGVDTPAHTCGLADTSDGACAADSGLTVEDAWANHHTNAQSCAADRVRHRALIEFLTERAAE